MSLFSPPVPVPHTDMNPGINQGDVVFYSITFPKYDNNFHFQYNSTLDASCGRGQLGEPTPSRYVWGTMKPPMHRYNKRQKKQRSGGGRRRRRSHGRPGGSGSRRVYFCSLKSSSKCGTYPLNSAAIAYRWPRFTQSAPPRSLMQQPITSAVHLFICSSLNSRNHRVCVGVSLQTRMCSYTSGRE